VNRYYNSWIENTDQVVDEDVSSTLSAGPSESSNQPEAAAAGDHESLNADIEMSDQNVSAALTDDDSDEDDDEDDDVDVLRSFM